MPSHWLIRVYDRQETVFERVCRLPLVFGRQCDESGGDGLYTFQPARLDGPGFDRVAIARPAERRISREHAHLDDAPGGRVVVRNVSNRVPIGLGLGDGREVPPGATLTIDPPALLVFDKKAVRVERSVPGGIGDALRALDEPADPSVEGSDVSGQKTTFGRLEFAGRGTGEGATVVRWLKATLGVLRSAANDSEFFEKAARAVVEVVGLDAGWVLLRDGGGWRTAAAYAPPDARAAYSGGPSRRVLERVRADRRTFYDVLPPEDGDGSSMAGIASFVAAPVLDGRGEVAAVLYGHRQLLKPFDRDRRVTEADATVVDLLGTCVATGLARQAQERVVVALQTQFEQFFTPELARQLAARPDLLEGQDSEITLLFCDIRDFSRLSPRLGPAGTMEWVGDVMSTLSDCVLEREGVLVNYTGDELMAMWGAPETQPDHAARASRAALAMIDQLPALNARWQQALGGPMSFGVGLNSGVARVGNTGSRRKFHYGPLGDTVNVASRVQGATKYFKSLILMTRATRDRLAPDAAARRVGKVRLLNISDPVELFEPAPPDDPDWPALNSAYESALADYEAKNFPQAARALGNLLLDHPQDGPALALLSRAVGCMVEAPDPFDPAFRLAGK